MRGRAIAVLAAGSVFLAFGTAEAAPTHSTTVDASYNYSQNKVSGKVTSSNTGCVPSRAMSLFHHPGGGASSTPAGTSTTTSNGSYEITATVTPVPGDTWEVVAAGRNLGQAGGGKSPDDDSDTLKPKKKKKKKKGKNKKGGKGNGNNQGYCAEGRLTIPA